MQWTPVNTRCQQRRRKLSERKLVLASTWFLQWSIWQIWWICKIKILFAV
jgi:hypothetical protein